MAPPPLPPEIHLENVSFGYGDSLTLKPTTLTLAAGEVTALLGPSGCGKSTLLRLILGLLTPRAGTVTIGDQPLTPANARPFRHRIGYVVQDGGLFPHLTAGENVVLLAEHLGRRRQQLTPRLAELAELTRLPLELLARYPGELSGGQRQRVGIMRALLLDPPILLLDEPMGALDPVVRADLQDDLARILKAAPKTVVLVTHDLGEAEHLAGRAVVLADGEVAQVGGFAELRTAPATPTVARFVAAHRRLAA